MQDVKSECESGVMRDSQCHCRPYHLTNPTSSKEPETPIELSDAEIKSMILASANRWRETLKILA